MVALRLYRIAKLLKIIDTNNRGDTRFSAAPYVVSSFYWRQLILELFGDGLARQHKKFI